MYHVRRFLIILAVLSALLAAGGIYLQVKKTKSLDTRILFESVDSMPWQEGDLVLPGSLVAAVDKQPLLKI